MIPRPDLLDADSPRGIEVFQLTDDPALPSCHIYMEAQIFTPDSRRLILHRSSHPHGRDKHDPRHQYQLCDLDNGGALTTLTTEVGTIGPSLSPDGRVLYYFIDEGEPGAGRVVLKRVNLDGSERETILVIDTPLSAKTFAPSNLYPLSTISSDGRRLATAAFLGDGQTAGSPFGLIVCDLAQATAQIILSGTSWCNLHPQYCRATDAESAHDIMVQENHEAFYDTRGTITQLVGNDGADIHLIRDDGTNFRNFAWGRNGNEFCQGHQCWIGQTTIGITSTSTKDVNQAQLIAGDTAPFAGHAGIRTPGGRRNDLSRDFPNPHYYHFATDRAGRVFVTDSGTDPTDLAVCLAKLPVDPLRDPMTNLTHLVHSRSRADKGGHVHPFLSPDGTMAFYNSNESGTLQAYMIRGLNTI